MSNKRADISQIRKYLNGELDARAMHQLEREALDDPFLADAIEGYARKAKDDDDALADLNVRLKQRISPPAKRIALWPVISIAASVLIFMAVGGWWFLRTTPAANDPQNRIAKDKTEVVKPPAAPLPIERDTMPKQDLAVLKPATPKPMIQEAPVVNNVAPQVLADRKERDKAMAEELLASESAAKAKQSARDTAILSAVTSGLVIARNQDISTEQKSAASAGYYAPRQEEVSKMIQGSLPGVSISKKGNAMFFVTGYVYSKADETPLPGVSITITGKSRGTQTDTEGFVRYNSR